MVVARGVNSMSRARIDPTREQVVSGRRQDRSVHSRKGYGYLEGKSGRKSRTGDLDGWGE